MAYFASFDSIHAATNPSGNSFQIGSAVSATDIKIYPVDPVAFPTNTGSFVSTGSAQSIWLEYVDGGSVTQRIECTLTHGAQRDGIGAEDVWAFTDNLNGDIFVLTSGG